MRDGEAGHGGDAGPPGWDEFRAARRRFLDRLERQSELLMLERLWQTPAAMAAERRPRAPRRER